MGDAKHDPGDTEILALASEQGRVLVTLDKDFGELIFLQGHVHCGLVRLVDIPSRLQGRCLIEVIKNHGDALALKAMLTVDTQRVRIRLPLV